MHLSEVAMASNDSAAVTTVSPSIPNRLVTRSPRSSNDSSPRTPNSPFLHNLSNRFRKGSAASNQSNGSDPPTQSVESQDTKETAQSARRFVLSVVRNDWDWPPPQHLVASDEKNGVEGETAEESSAMERKPVGWRIRHEGASDLDLEDISTMTGTGRRKSKRSSDPYKFENPDAIANVIHEQRMKRKRQNAQETLWNDGLRTWTERRDMWTAAQRHKPRKLSTPEEDGQDRTLSPARGHHKSSTSEDDGKSQKSGPSAASGVTDEEYDDKSTTRKSSECNGVTEDEKLNGPYLPIYPPLFPSSHILRARIKPASYPTIYSKVVLQSLTPNVPIPLTHMIGALVDGWKSEGNWPPQTLAEQQQHALLKRAKGATKGESAFQKWRRDREAERKCSVNLLEDGFIQEIAPDDEDAADQKKGFRRSISGAVKKVLGIHPPAPDEDGGLAQLGLSFQGPSEEEEKVDGLMKEDRQVAEDNVVLNKVLLEGLQ